MPGAIETLSREVQHRSVRDLIWAWHSPGLLWDGAAPHWLRANQPISEETIAWLRRLDRDPLPLQERLTETRSPRLGHYFEALIGFWLAQHPGYSLLAANVPIRDGNRTLGELDFLYREPAGQTLIHLEVAVKFYLQDGPATDIQSWVGPNRNDRLADKFARLRDHQSRLCQQPATQAWLQQQGYPLPRSAILTKGRMFYKKYPEDDHTSVCFQPGHLLGRWYRSSDWRPRYIPGIVPYRLPKPWWLAEVLVQDLPSLGTLPTPFLGIQQPEQLLLWSPSAQREWGRVFVVPDDWDNAKNEGSSSNAAS